MQKLSIQHMQFAVRSALRPRLPQHILARHAYLSTSARCYRSGDDALNKTVSTDTTAATQKKPGVKPVTVETESGNPELPKFSLDGLGVSKNMKIFLIVVLSIFGTMETWFYCKAIWRWWYGEQGLAVTTDDK
ncbi:uncharacterized protein BBA_05667 [Beauveria bassiana ARSEF 2860]|uniref:Uncharacterized protein n=1 Tax=Beauveria bassiana (strain ARSEF 2860) TaxID=655819 RepID=J5JRF5_BEAB2|nr:uncharacterized protein BBA_05667 [Beauveria bassiana ARSEF 2860]EJP65336.1 hypothetical protein BBA_05667 [Beauveria bassiana ARSEF 2860]